MHSACYICFQYLCCVSDCKPYARPALPAASDNPIQLTLILQYVIFLNALQSWKIVCQHIFSAVSVSCWITYICPFEIFFSTCIYAHPGDPAVSMRVYRNGKELHTFSSVSYICCIHFHLAKYPFEQFWAWNDVVNELAFTIPTATTYGS